MEFEILGDEPDGPTLELDYREFAYAGKFVMSSTGKSVARADGDIVGAVAFSEDHSDPGAVRLRYVTVREDRRGEGVGARLLRFTAAALADRYDRVLIAVNNPIAYQSCYRAGFAFTGEETGIAELLLAYDPEGGRSAETYRTGLQTFETRDLPEKQRAVVADHSDGEPPPVVDVPA
jgi:GNAT superfamily N-acetyltransferase